MICLLRFFFKYCCQKCSTKFINNLFTYKRFYSFKTIQYSVTVNWKLFPYVGNMYEFISELVKYLFKYCYSFILLKTCLLKLSIKNSTKNWKELLLWFLWCLSFLLQPACYVLFFWLNFIVNCAILSILK